MRPDIVLFHCHDLGRWLPAYGMSAVPAPTIAAFAAQSVVFDDAHSAAPLCSPARAALFTGLAPYANGVQGLAHDGWRYRAGVSTLPERLAPLGYHSALIGLQHENVDPTVLGFDEHPGLGFLPRTGQVVAAAGDWLRALEPKPERKPVFLTVGAWEVHRPWPAADYPPADPDTVDVPGFLPDNAHTREDIAAFYGSIAQLDAGFSALLAHITASIGDDDTMVIFTTDHGAAFPRAKSTLYDAGTGVALIIRPPRSWHTPPRRVQDIVTHQDLLPTLLHLAAGRNAAADPPGTRSLLSYLQEAQPADDDAERLIFTSKDYHDTYDPKRAARSREYVYIRNYEEGPALDLPIDIEASQTRKGIGDAHLEPRPSEELYHRETDPDELTNIAAEGRYQDVKNRYAQALHEWLTTTGDPVETEPLPRPPHRTRHVDDLPPVTGNSDQAPTHRREPSQSPTMSP